MQHTWVRDVTRKYEWVMSWFWMSRSSCQMDICMRHGATMNGSCQTCLCVVSQWWMVCVTRMKVMSQKQITRTTHIHWSFHTRKRHITPKIESCHFDGWFVSRACNSCQKKQSNRTAHMDGSFHTCERHIALKIEYTYGWVTSHVSMSHVTRIKESCHTYEGVISHIWMRHAKHINESCHTHVWVLSHMYVLMSHTWMSHVTHT